MVKISSKLKKLLVCGASLALMASLGNGINNVSAHSVHHHTYTERVARRNQQFVSVMKYLHWVNWFDKAHTQNFNGWKLRHLNVYMQGLTYRQKRYINNYKKGLSRYNRHAVRKHYTKRTKHARHHKVPTYKVDQSKSSSRTHKYAKYIAKKSNTKKHEARKRNKHNSNAWFYHHKRHSYRTHKQAEQNTQTTPTRKPNINLSSSRVNKYIVDNNLQHAKIQHHVLNYLPHLAYKHGVGHPDGVVVHETGNPYSNIFGEINFMKHDWGNAFVHSFVDDNNIINIANTNYQAWGVAYPGNAHFLQFEQTEMHSKRDFAKEVNNAAYYTAHLLKQYHLTPKDAEYTGKGTVWSHALVAKYMGGSDHVDPVTYYANDGREFFGQPYTMRQFYQLVLHYYYA